jgi:hypothetical protein
MKIVSSADTIKLKSDNIAINPKRLRWNIAAVVVGIVAGTFSVNFSSGSNYFAMLEKEGSITEMNVYHEQKKKQIKCLVTSFNFNPTDMGNETN